MLVSQLIHRFTHPRVRGTLNHTVVGLTNNSRNAGPGIVFVALPEGQRTNPYQAIAAVERGAAAVICAPGVPLPEHGTCITVSDPTQAMALAAAELYDHPSDHLEMVQVKGARAATVAHLLHQLLNACGKSAGLLTSQGCQLGDRYLPTPVERLEPLVVQESLRHLVRAGHKACVVEQSSQTEAVNSFHGIRFHASLEIEDSPVSNGLTSLGHNLSAGPLRATELVLSQAATHFNVSLGRHRVVVRCPLVGRALAIDLLYALRASIHLGLQPNALTRACSRLKPIPGSLAPVRSGQPFAVLVDGADLAESLANSIRDAAEITPGRILVVLGGSADHTVAERETLGRAAAHGADEVIVTNHNPRELDATSLARDVLQGVHSVPGAISHVELDRYRAIRRALRLASRGDTVLITGKGHRCIQQLERCVIPFDDAIVARETLAEIGYSGSEL